MTVLRTINGNLIFTPETDGLMTTQSANDPCCCEESPTCCYDANCEIVDCDSPEAIGDVPGCDPCRLNFCGFCPPGQNQSISHDQTLTSAGRDLTPVGTVCDAVEPESYDLELDFRSTLVDRNSSSTVQALLIYRGCVSSRLSIGYSFQSGLIRLSTSTSRHQNGVFTESPTILEITQSANIPLGSVWELKGSLRASGFVFGPYLAECVREFEYTLEVEMTYKLTAPDGSVIFDGSFESLGQTSELCRPSLGKQRDVDQNLEIFDNRNDIDPTSFVRAATETKPFVQTLPTCDS